MWPSTLAGDMEWGVQKTEFEVRFWPLWVCLWPVLLPVGWLVLQYNDGTE